MSEFWSYKNLNNVPAEFRLTLNEGNTPIRKLNFEGQQIMVKDENTNPNGSFKDRSLAYQVSYHVSKGVRKFVISSSGNAAVSAAAYCGLAGVELDIFVANQVNEKKLEKINVFLDSNIKLHRSNKPRSDAIKFARETGIKDLRGSVDDKAIVGYTTIAFELAKQFPEIDSIFIPCSSGTSALGVYQGFKKLKMKVKLFICQTSKVHSIASRFDKDFVKTSKSYADAIVDKIALRKKDVIDAVKNSNGSGIIVNDALISYAKGVAEANGFFYSNNSLLGLAGLIKLNNKGIKLNKPVILASGL